MACSVALGLWMVGCSKKEAATETPAASAKPKSAADAAGQAQPAAETAAADAGADTGGGGGDFRSQWNSYDTAIKKKDYESAAGVLLKAQLSKAPMTQQQGFDYINHMRELSKKIADAAASGDPNAQRAAEMMRQVQAMQMMRR